MKRISTFLALNGLLAAIFLAGCSAIGPGFQDTASGAPPPQSSGAGTADEGVPPAGALTEIDPELISRLKAQQPTQAGADIVALLGNTEAYRIGPGDVLGITVFDHPELISSAIPATTVADPASVSPAPGFIVSDAGRLTFPYAGTLKVEGMTVQQVEDTITQRLDKMFRKPQVSVRIQAFRSKRVYVEGEVRAPGLQVFTDIPMTLPEAINRAGGILPTGDRSFVTLTRGEKTTNVDLMLLGEVGVDPTRIPLRNGDMVMVRNREDRKIFVMGEVLRPAAILMRNGRLSLNDALGEAGGVDLGTANPRQIYVVRNKPEGGQAVFHLDGRTATALALADNFPLEPKDVVYVDPVSLVRWNRIVSLILPSAQGANLIRGTYK